MMDCNACHSTTDLICQNCYKIGEQKLISIKNQQRMKQLRQKVESKVKEINIKKIQQIFEKEAKMKKVQRVRDRIKDLYVKIQVERQKSKRLRKIKQTIKSDLAVQPQKQHIDEAKNLYFQNLLNKNAKLNENIIKLKKEYKKVIQKIMKIYRIEQKKYRIQKYYKAEGNEKIIFTLEKGTNGIPLIKANSQQIIVYYPLEDWQTQEQHSIINIIKMSAKLIVVAHKIFLNQVKLPYKLFYSKNQLYLGNLLVNFNQNLPMNCDKLKIAINMLQSNIQYMSYVIGSPEKPFLTLDKTFFDWMQSRNFEITGFDSDRAWQSYLKFLKPQEIEKDYDEQNQTEPISLQSESVYIFSKKSNTSEEQFEILQ